MTPEELRAEELFKLADKQEKELDVQISFNVPNFEAEKYWELFNIDKPYWRK
jgi:hypothetical protein